MKKIVSILFLVLVILNVSAQFRRIVLRPTHGQIIGTYIPTNQPLRAWMYGDKMYVIQGEMDDFVVRGGNILTRADVSSKYKNYSRYFAEITDDGGLASPKNFVIPFGCIQQNMPDATIAVLCGKKATDAANKPSTLPKEVPSVLSLPEKPSALPQDKPLSTARRGVGYELKFSGFPKISDGFFYLKADGSIKEVVSKLKIENGKLSDEQWDRSFYNDNRYEKGFYIGLGAKSTTAPLQNVDISAMAGFDLSVIEVYTEKGKYWNAGSWIQQYITVPGKRMVTDTVGKVVYFWNPGKQVSESILPDFYDSFPEFNLPKGKIVKFSYASATDISGEKATKRGVSFVHNAANPSKRAVMDYDGWLYNVGCPKAYTVPQEVLNKWLAGIDAKVLRQSFSQVVGPNIKTGYLSLNFEAIGVWNPTKDFGKIAYAFQEIKSQHAEGEFVVWNLHPKTLSRPMFEGGGNTQGFTDILKWQGQGFEGFRKTFPQMSYSVLWENVQDFVTVAHVGGYCSDLRNIGAIYHLMSEGLVAKKIAPDKKVLANIWHEVEIFDWQLGEQNHRTSNGETFKIQVKPIAPPDLMQSWGVWSMWLDGLDLWSDPNTKVDNPDLWGSKAKEMEGDKYKENRFGANLSSYPFQSQKNIDWLMAGVWAMSMNKDILEANTPIEYPDVILPDGRKVTGDNKLPTESFIKGFPLVMKKRDDKSNDILYTAYWGHNAANKTVKLIVDGIEIEIKGQYTSVVRVKK